MLQLHLKQIKAELIKHFTERLGDMYSLQGEWEEYYDDVTKVVGEITRIQSLNDLDAFCESWGLNEIEDEFAFYAIAARYLSIPNPVNP